MGKSNSERNIWSDPTARQAMKVFEHRAPLASKKVRHLVERATNTDLLAFKDFVFEPDSYNDQLKSDGRVNQSITKSMRQRARVWKGKKS